MMHAKRTLWAMLGALGAVAAACSAEQEPQQGPDGSRGPADDGSLGDSDRGSEQVPTATGVIVVHAARFPAFRLCFSNFPELPPQPDTDVMPEANVVGVEIGSLVRLDPMKAPGTIYVINESEVRSSPGETNAISCGERLGSTKKSQATLVADNDYHVANVIDTPLGSDSVTVLAITGCGSQAFLNSLGLPNENCGDSWNVTSGNLEARIVPLTATREAATDTTLPVQLFHMSPELEHIAQDARFEVTFGELTSQDTGEGQKVPIGALFAGGEQKVLSVDQTQQAFYGSHGFRVSIPSSGEAIEVEQSLAEIQELSSPRSLPTSYYRAASNYALLLLGDPSHTDVIVDGGANPNFDPRRALHFLAVPVIEPSIADAGVEDASVDEDVDGGT